MAEIFNPISKNGIGTRNGFLKLNQPSRKTKQGQIFLYWSLNLEQASRQY